jgi:Leucine-rich repeat (LRR) protein
MLLVMTSAHDIKLYAENLIALYEKADDEKERAYYIREFGGLRLRTERVFIFLENCLLSDESPQIRCEAARSLILTFDEKCKKPIRWSIQQEIHAFFFKTLLDLAENSNNVFADELKSYIFNRFSEIYGCHKDDAKFLWDLDSRHLKTQADYTLDHRERFRGANKVDITFQESWAFYTVKNRRIRAINLTHWDLEILPESLGNLTGLRYLNLTRNELRILPPSIKNLKNLRELCLCRNNLVILPDWLANLPKLRRLNLSGNPIKSTPNWLIKFAECNYNYIYTFSGVIPSEATILSLLEVLSGLRLFKLDQDKSNLYGVPTRYYKINEDGHITTICLDQSNPGLGIFPEKLCELGYLEELYIKCHRLTKIPHNIDNLKNLRVLDLWGNNIRKIPETITKLKHLKVLNLRGNKIRMIEKEIYSFLRQLEKFEMF